MKIFISWSGDRSKEIAKHLKKWIKSVIQATEPWMSDTDIDRGSIWFSDIFQNLEKSNVGIVCLTAENKDEPWILFEAGALAKGVKENRVMTLLFGLKPNDVTGPLSQFNHTVFTKADMNKLVKTINGHLGSVLNETELDSSFEMWWPSLQKDIDEVLKQSSPEKPKLKGRSSAEITNEILALVRAIDKRTAMALTPKMDFDAETEPISKRYLNSGISRDFLKHFDDLEMDKKMSYKKLFGTGENREGINWEKVYDNMLSNKKDFDSVMKEKRTDTDTKSKDIDI